MNLNSKIYIAGHRGMVGSAIHRKLSQEGYRNFILKNSRELDLRNQAAVFDFFEREKPEYVFLSAAKVGGIIANNTFRGEFLYDNLMIESNIIHASYLHKVEKLLFLGSSCIYPKLASQPLQEDALLSGYLEYTNEPYAIAKIAGIKLCENYRLQYGCNFISAMPTNLYGTGDNYHPEHSHVIPGLINKFYNAILEKKDTVTIWGTGAPLREFMHADDLADALVYLMKNYNELQFINVGSQMEVSIKELAMLIQEISNYQGKLEFDTTKPDGTPRKLMNSSKIHNLGWHAKINLREGLEKTWGEFVEGKKG